MSIDFDLGSELEECLYPYPDIISWDNGNLKIKESTTMEKVVYYVKNFFTFVALIFASPLILTVNWLTKKEVKVLSEQKTPDIAPPPPAWPPVQRGFATSLFQTSGIGTKWAAAPPLAGKCDWDKWMDKPEHIIHPGSFDYRDFFVDVLSNPAPYIDMLLAQNVTAHRFSLEMSVLMPRPGEIDMEAVALYRNFINRLIAQGISPSITLCHFVLPEWFYESGGFQNMENVDHFVNFSLRMMELFPNVTDWWSFNELGVKALQQVREAYPTDVSEGSSLSTRIDAAARSTRNMLIAHCKLHKEVERLHPDKKVGVTHQWLEFDTASGNWLEKLIAYFFTKFAFTPVYDFFAGKPFAIQIPFMANIQFEIPKEEFEAHKHFLMQLGVQAYPKAMLKMGLNDGETYPGPSSAVTNSRFFTFGATCEPGGTVMRFGPRWKAKEIDAILDKAFALTKDVKITEYGSDARMQQWGDAEITLKDQAQADYLQQLTERIRDYTQRTGRELKGLFCWSDLRRQMEWENGFECKLGMIHPIVDENRRFIGSEGTPASQYLAEAFAPPQQPAAEAAAG